MFVTQEGQILFVESTDTDIEADYTIRVTATLDDTAATSASTEFLLAVGDGCEADVISLITAIPDTLYDISPFEPTPVVLTPEFE